MAKQIWQGPPHPIRRIHSHQEKHERSWKKLFLHISKRFIAQICTQIIILNYTIIYCQSTPSRLGCWSRESWETKTVLGYHKSWSPKCLSGRYCLELQRWLQLWSRPALKEQPRFPLLVRPLICFPHQAWQVSLDHHQPVLLESSCVCIFHLLDCVSKFWLWLLAIEPIWQTLFRETALFSSVFSGVMFLGPWKISPSSSRNALLWSRRHPRGQPRWGPGSYHRYGRLGQWGCPLAHHIAALEGQARIFHCTRHKERLDSKLVQQALLEASCVPNYFSTITETAPRGPHVTTDPSARMAAHALRGPWICCAFLEPMLDCRAVTAKRWIAPT